MGTWVALAVPVCSAGHGADYYTNDFRRVGTDTQNQSCVNVSIFLWISWRYGSRDFGMDWGDDYDYNSLLFKTVNLFMMWML